MRVSKISPFLKWTLITTVVFIVAAFVICIIFDLEFVYALGFYVSYIALFGYIYKADVLGEIGFFALFFNQKDYAYELCRRACDMGTNSVHALHLHGVRLLRENHAAEALELFKKAKRKNRAVIIDKALYLNISVCHWKLGEIDIAIETITELRNKYTYVNPDVYTTLGYMYFLKEDFEKAADYTQRALDDSPEHGPAWDNMGQIHFAKGDYDSAMECFEKAIEVKPTMADSKYYLGLIYELKNDIENAKKYFRLASETNITALNTVSREQIMEKLNSI